jgi:putative oxidoreductase
MDIGLLIARVVVGLAMAAHGAQKLFGWFGGAGPTGTGGFFEMLGFHPGTLFAVAAGLGEFGGGVLTALGLFGPCGPALVILVMLVALVAVHRRNGFFVTSNGIEVPLIYAAAALAFGMAGPGAFALDTVLGLPGWPVMQRWIAIGIGVVGAGVVLAARRTPPTPAPAAA